MTNAFLDGRLIVRSGDLTEQNVDAIVNAANSTLLGGGGVDGAIHQRGGPAILEACREIRRTRFPNGLPTGEAVLTTGGDLPARYVIHTVGPIYGLNNGRDGELLAACYQNSIRVAVANQLATIAFPSISTGAFGYPKHLAAPVVFDAIEAEIGPLTSSDLIVHLVFFNPSDIDTFLQHAGI